MKHAIFLSLASTVLLITACKDQTKSAYYDLNRDEDVDLVKDDATGRMIDAKSRQAPYIYVNNETNDTIYGATGEVINGHVIRLEVTYDKRDNPLPRKSQDDAPGKRRLSQTRET